MTSVFVFESFSQHFLPDVETDLSHSYCYFICAVILFFKSL